MGLCTKAIKNKVFSKLRYIQTKVNCKLKKPIDLYWQFLLLCTLESWLHDSLKKAKCKQLNAEFNSFTDFIIYIEL